MSDRTPAPTAGDPPANDRLTDDQRHKLSLLLEVLATDEHSPTAIRTPEQAARLHVADSLAALQLERVRAARTLADLGSGAGFPGLALAVALPASEVALVESQRRKCEFLERICAAAGVENVRVVCARAEEWREGTGHNDVVLARALAAQPVVLEYAAPLLRLGGSLVDWRGRRSREDEAAAEHAAAILGLRRELIVRVASVEGVTDHHLHVFEKIAPTPARFPRRPGIARKRPLAE